MAEWCMGVNDLVIPAELDEKETSEVDIQPIDPESWKLSPYERLQRVDGFVKDCEGKGEYFIFRSGGDGNNRGEQREINTVCVQSLRYGERPAVRIKFKSTEDLAGYLLKEEPTDEYSQEALPFPTLTKKAADRKRKNMLAEATELYHTWAKSAEILLVKLAQLDGGSPKAGPLELGAANPTAEMQDRIDKFHEWAEQDEETKMQYLSEAFGRLDLDGEAIMGTTFLWFSKSNNIDMARRAVRDKMHKVIDAHRGLIDECICFLPSSLLKGNVTLKDCPGVGDEDPLKELESREAFSQMTSAVLVIDGNTSSRMDNSTNEVCKALRKAGFWEEATINGNEKHLTALLVQKTCEYDKAGDDSLTTKLKEILIGKAKESVGDEKGSHFFGTKFRPLCIRPREFTALLASNLSAGEWHSKRGDLRVKMALSPTQGAPMPEVCAGQ